MFFLTYDMNGFKLVVTFFLWALSKQLSSILFMLSSFSFIFMFCRGCSALCEVNSDQKFEFKSFYFYFSISHFREFEWRIQSLKSATCSLLEVNNKGPKTNTHMQIFKRVHSANNQKQQACFFATNFMVKYELVLN